MEHVIIYTRTRLDIEREVAAAIEKYPQLAGESENIKADMIEVYAETGKVAEIVLRENPTISK